MDPGTFCPKKAIKLSHSLTCGASLCPEGVESAVEVLEGIQLVGLICALFEGVRGAVDVFGRYTSFNAFMCTEGVKGAVELVEGVQLLVLVCAMFEGVRGVVEVLGRYTTCGARNKSLVGL